MTNQSNQQGSLRELLEAAETVLAGLEARIEAAPPDAVPVFDGVAALHDAIGHVRQQLDEIIRRVNAYDDVAETARRRERREILAELEFLLREHCADNGEARGMSLCIGSLHMRIRAEAGL